MSLLPITAAEAADGVTESQLHLLDPSSEPTSVLLETVKELLKNEQLADALPFLEEALLRLEGDPTKKALQTKAFSLYQLGQCHMKLGTYDLGAEYFIRFATEFPEDYQVDEARIQAAQCLTILQQWPEVETQALLILEDKSISEELRVSALQLLVESLYRQEKWKQAAPRLISLYRVAKKDTVRTGAAVMLITSYVRLNDYNSLFSFLPHCGQEARNDVGLNVALLEAGDGQYNQGSYQKALLLYRVVLLKTELIGHHEKRLREMKSDMKPYLADGKQTISDYRDELAVKQKNFDRVMRNYKNIKAFQDYDLDVALRMAQCYSELGRNWPAHAIYRRVCEENPGLDLADQARYSAFSVLLTEHDWQLASAEGNEYVEKLPAGNFIDEVTLNLMQLYLQREQLQAAYEMGRTGLRLSPHHKHIDQVKYLMGYIHFIQQDYADALEIFGESLKRWPDSRYYESTEYWRSMSLLFLGRYTEAVTAFKAYLSNPRYDDERRFEEDAAYRLGIAEYGAELYVDAEATFNRFLLNFPESPMVSEAYAMLGDLRAAEGDLDVSLEHYALARETALNMAQVSYPLFQSAKVLELKKDYAEIIALTAGYLEKWGKAGDYANAVKWQAKSYKALNNYPKVLDVCLETVDAYGADSESIGVDAILSGLAEDGKSEDWADYRVDILNAVTERLLAAEAERKKALILRYQAVLAGLTDGAQRETYFDALVQADNVRHAGAGVLVIMAREGVRREDYDVVHAAYDRFMATYAISSDMLYVMNANLDALVEEGGYTDAIALADQILERFGYSPSVGWARLRRGDAFRLQAKYDEALEAYKEVLSIREWRGALTPQALFYSGLCKLEEDKVDEAFAYFQRIYVLYEEYIDWSAPAYARSVECLELLGGRNQEIVNTYKEMLANEKIAATPEGRKAHARLQELAPGEVAQ